MIAIQVYGNIELKMTYSRKHCDFNALPLQPFAI